MSFTLNKFFIKVPCKFFSTQVPRFVEGSNTILSKVLFLNDSGYSKQIGILNQNQVYLNKLIVNKGLPAHKCIQQQDLVSKHIIARQLAILNTYKSRREDVITNLDLFVDSDRKTLMKRCGVFRGSMYLQKKETRAHIDNLWEVVNAF